ncbi:MAG: hypothetical protein K0R25_435 [Rickettsiaceae bacterium]|jgi:rare lipoprotein A|nr:hypothetical protein [Rickettsiaceae bacterium]
MFRQNNIFFSLKPLLLISLFFTASCVGSNKNAPEEEGSEIRIVDLNGNPKPVQRFVPEGNAQALASIQADNNKPAENAPAAVAQQQISQDLPVPQEPTSSQAIQEPTAAPSPGTSTIIADTKQPAQVSYDMGAENLSATKAAAIATKPVASETPASDKKYKLVVASTKTENSAATSTGRTTGIFVQVGFFSLAENANKALEKNKAFCSGKIEEVTSGDKKSYRVLLGPVQNKKKASKILKKAKNAGYKDAFIVK